MEFNKNQIWFNEVYTQNTRQAPGSWGQLSRYSTPTLEKNFDDGKNAKNSTIIVKNFYRVEDQDGTSTSKFQFE
jgi:hypothetical protein